MLMCRERFVGVAGWLGGKRREGLEDARESCWTCMQANIHRKKKGTGCTSYPDEYDMFMRVARREITDEYRGLEGAK